MVENFTEEKRAGDTSDSSAAGEMRLSEERFRQLANSLPGFVWTAGPDGALTYLNDRWYAYTGLTPEQSLGSGWAQTLHPDDYDRCVAVWQDCLRSGVLYEVENRYRRADGRYRWFLARAEPLRDASGQVVAWCGTSTDVHDRRMADQERANLLALEQEARAQAEAERERAAFLAQASEILASSLDYGRTLADFARLVVPRIADYFTLFEIGAGREMRLIAVAHTDPAKEEVLRRIGEIYRIVPDNPHSAMTRVTRTGRPEILNPSEESLRLGTPSHESFSLAASLATRSVLLLPLVTRGEVLGLMNLAMAESGRDYDEEDFLFGQELARRAAGALENARLYHDARAANDAKDRFLATLSHELRTPLTPVLALASGLAQDPRLPADARERMTRIKRNVELEARLIDDLLDLTRISRGKIELRHEVADARPILEQALATSLPDLEAKGLRLSAELDAGEHRVWADPPRMAQVFWNLLQNAVKFTPAGGTITVRSRVDGDLSVAISDTGIGIEPEVLPRIFDAFEQGQRSITRRFGGLGLGLAISKAIVELHGGQLTAESAGAGFGTTFTVRLPLYDGAETPASAPGERSIETAGAAAQALHILLVEDHGDTAEAMAEVLRDMGHRVTVAGSVAAALTEAAIAQKEEEHPERSHGRIDLVVSDLGLPDGSGLDLMRELTGHYGLKGIALSGYGMEEDVRRSLEAGFGRHLTKPVTPQTLRAVILETAGS